MLLQDMEDRMRCEACKCEDRWTDETLFAIPDHPELDEVWMMCECGHEQEVMQ